MIASVEMICRPISVWPGKRTRRHVRSHFKTPWAKTADLLAREVAHLGGRSLVLEIEVEERHLRNDGWLYANASPEGPGVIVNFDSKHGPLRYPCDTFAHWHENVRAVALALEALRKVDRYGVTSFGEQYRGFTALPAPGDSVTFDVDASAKFVSACCDGAFSADDIFEYAGSCRLALKVASKSTHPDHNGGDEERFKLLQKAKEVLLRHHGDAA